MAFLSLIYMKYAVRKALLRDLRTNAAVVKVNTVNLSLRPAYAPSVSAIVLDRLFPCSLGPLYGAV
jgi:hypothetical protein